MAGKAEQCQTYQARLFADWSSMAAGSGHGVVRRQGDRTPAAVLSLPHLLPAVSERETLLSSKLAFGIFQFLNLSIN